MKSHLAHGLRRIARWLIAASNHLLPPTVDDLVAGFEELLLVDLDGSSCRSVRLTGYDGSTWPLDGPPAHEEC